MEAAQWGRIVGVFGSLQEGLNIDQMRQASATLAQTPIGDRVCSVVIGPLDSLSVEGILDVLLKTLEEGTSRVRGFLWALDEGQVSATIRSRCLEVWCPGEIRHPKEVTEAAKAILSALIKGSSFGILDAVESFRPSWKDLGVDLTQALVEQVCKQDLRSDPIWIQKIRPLCLQRSLSCDEFAAGLL